jgi:hypothetical protein
MKPRLLLLAFVACASFAEAGEPTLAAGTRIRVQTDVPPWTEAKGVREVPGEVLHQDEDSLTFRPKDGGEPLTGTKKGGWLIGELVSSDEQYLVLRRPGTGDLLRVPTGLVSRVQVSKGGSRGRSAGMGAIFGACVLGLMMAASDWEPKELAVGMGVGAGAAFGGMLGAAGGGEGWAPTSTTRLRIAVAPQRGGLGARVTLRF